MKPAANLPRAAYIFDMEIAADARAQKEIDTLLRAGVPVRVLEWNKDEAYPLQKKTLPLRGREITVESIGIPVRKGVGIRGNLGPLLRFQLSLFRWLRQNRQDFDLVHCVNLDTAFCCRLFGRFFRKPYIYDIFDDYADAHTCGPKLRRLIKKIDYRVVRGARRVLLCSEKRRQQLAGPADNVEIIYNSPDIAPPEADITPETNTPFTVVYAGNLKDGRLLPQLLQVLARHPEWRLECGGDGELKPLLEQAAAEHPHIRYHGRLPYEQVLALEQAGHVVPALYDPAVPNHAFAAPNKVFEAMSLGKPTVMVRGTGMADLVEKEKTGLVIPDCSPEALEKVLLEISQSLPRWQAEAPRIRQLFAERYSWNHMERKLLRIYVEI